MLEEFYGNLLDDKDAGERRHKIYEVSLARIRRCDFMFAYINETDCHGTKFEIGYASALQKPIFLCFGDDLHWGKKCDLWFIARCADAVFQPPVEHAFGKAMTLWRKAWRGPVGIHPWTEIVKAALPEFG